MTDRATPTFFVEPGHFYSPVADPGATRRYLASPHYARQRERVLAMLDLPGMERLWAELEPLALDFPFEPAPPFRYHGRNGQFMYFDATILSGLVAHLNPARVIEIGAGFSSAAMFDTFDRMAAPRLQTFLTIDPDLSRIRRLSPPKSAQMMAAEVQSLPPETFDVLDAGDLLFIDSSHVLKTGSDVHYEYLHILPRLKPGVIVHIHDVPFPFEYPDRWTLRENRSWNEAYLVDMLLTHGRTFEIVFFNDAFLTLRDPALRKPGDMFDRFASFPTRAFHSINASIWLRRL
jgi:predicted O-methyltransferase YrrM